MAIYGGRITNEVLAGKGIDDVVITGHDIWEVFRRLTCRSAGLDGTSPVKIRPRRSKSAMPPPWLARPWAICTSQGRRKAGGQNAPIQGGSTSHVEHFMNTSPRFTSPLPQLDVGDTVRLEGLANHGYTVGSMDRANRLAVVLPDGGRSPRENERAAEDPLTLSEFRVNSMDVLGDRS